MVRLRGGACDMEYYKTLGLQKSATIDDVKKAYRKLAIKEHPDKTLDPVEKKRRTASFKKIGEAYHCLSDERLRKIYDDYGKQGIENDKMGAPPGWDGKSSPGFSFDPEMMGGGGGGQEFSFNDAQGIFDSFFGGKDPFSMFGGGGVWL
eukprot:jgi/Bigna1/135149/aug1.28_g9857